MKSIEGFSFFTKDGFQELAFYREHSLLKDVIHVHFFEFPGRSQYSDHMLQTSDVYVVRHTVLNEE